MFSVANFVYETVCSKNYSFTKSNAMKSAMKWKAINNEIMQWKTINRADKVNFFIIKFKGIWKLWFPDFFLRVTKFWCLRNLYSTSDPLYFTSPKHKHERTGWKSLPLKKKAVGCGVTYLEPTTRFHGYFIIGVLKRISFPISIILSFCLS